MSYPLPETWQLLTPPLPREALLGNNPVSNRTVTQLCNGRESARIIGIAIDTTGDLTAVRKFLDNELCSILAFFSTCLYLRHIFLLPWAIAYGNSSDNYYPEKIAVDLSKSRCVEQGNLIPGIDLTVKVFDIAGSPATNASNSSSVASNRTVTARTYRDRKRSVVVEKSGDLNKRATCSYIQVVSGE